LGSHDVVNMYVHNNTITQTDGMRAGGIANGDPNHDAYAGAANNVWANNTYTIGASTQFRWTGNVDTNKAGWLADGQDSGSTFTIV
jgi:hypothetical protein